MEHSTNSSNSSLQSPNKGFFNGVFHSSIAALIWKLCMLKIAYLQDHNVIGKKRISPTGL